MDYSSTDYLDENSAVETLEDEIYDIKITRREKDDFQLLKTKLLCYEKIRNTCKEILDVINDQIYIKDDKTTQEHKEGLVYKILRSNRRKYKDMHRDFPQNAIYKFTFGSMKECLDNYDDIDYVYFRFSKLNRRVLRTMERVRELMNEYTYTVAGVDITAESNRQLNNVFNTQYRRPTQARTLQCL